MHDVETVQIVDGDGDLRKDGEGVVFLERPLGKQLLEELAAAQALLDDVDAIRVTHNLEKLHHVRVADLLEDLYLHAQRVEELVVLELLTVEHLDRHLLLVLL